MAKILFVCIENSCRSQIAEGFVRYFGEGKVEVYSAGSKPSGKVNEMAIQVMREVGIEISSQTSKGFDALPYREFDIVVTMGCGDECPFIPAKERIDWQIQDPKGKTIQFFRDVRDEIKWMVMKLISKASENSYKSVHNRIYINQKSSPCHSRRY